LSLGRPAAALLWLAFAVLVAAAFWILLGACGLAWPGGRPMLLFCPADVDAGTADRALGAEQERQRALQGSIRELEIALLGRPYCPPSAQTLTEPATERPPSLEDTIREGDVQALEGCWEQASDLTLQVIGTGELITVQNWEVCFSDDGQGHQTMTFTSGVQCQGGVDAGFPDAETLRIDDTDHMQCDNGSYNVASTTTCKLAGDGTAACVRSDQDNPEHASPVTMRRTSR